MSVARVTELSATSQTGFEDAINQAVARATKTLRGVEGAWVKDQWVCPVSTDSLPLGHSTSSQSNLFVL
jgi:flavin-binding protein dodecin